jgi:hypothetical protein
MDFLSNTQRAGKRQNSGFFHGTHSLSGKQIFSFVFIGKNGIANKKNVITFIVIINQPCLTGFPFGLQ